MLPKARIENSTLTCPKIHPILTPKHKMSSKLYILPFLLPKHTKFCENFLKKSLRNFSKILDE